jgi:hypothetical protein
LQAGDERGAFRRPQEAVQGRIEDVLLLRVVVGEHGIEETQAVFVGMGIGALQAPPHDVQGLPHVTVLVTHDVGRAAGHAAARLEHGEDQLLLDAQVAQQSRLESRVASGGFLEPAVLHRRGHGPESFVQPVVVPGQIARHALEAPFLDSRCVHRVLRSAASRCR